MFQDRLDAARKLAEQLDELDLERPLVLAIPRGAVPMAKVIADALGGDLDVVLVRKLGAPGNPEFAIGAISEHGDVSLSQQSVMVYGQNYIDSETAAQLETLRQRRRSYTPIRTPIDPGGRNVVVVDDGSATGATMETALNAVRSRGPGRLVAALGVAPPDVVRRLEGLADDVVCLHAPTHFYAVGQFFSDFSQVTDEEVIRLLREHAQTGRADGRGHDGE
ncbi:MAG: phosphoribosyltransferase [Ectothiorhodospiraceae bacterium]|nr:phosphoribosyltransferase [Ectothiorhodospiraceae bacterium]